MFGEGKQDYLRIESSARTLVDARLKNAFNKSASTNKMYVLNVYYKIKKSPNGHVSFHRPELLSFSSMS